MNNQHPDSTGPMEPFRIRDCALVVLGTGIKAQNLREFLEGLQKIPEGSIYHHFWGRLLQSQFDEPEYNNDFAAWVYHGLHEKALAEQLSVIDPTDYDNIEDLRQDLIEVVEERLDQSEYVPWAKADQLFHFLKSKIVVFDSGRRLEDPKDLPGLIPDLSQGSIFYHFIDARRRTPERCDDFSAWLKGLKQCEDLRQGLMAIDPYFSSLKELRHILTDMFTAYF